MPVPPSVNRNETNIGHGGPGLGRQFETIFHRFPCAIAVLSVCALSLAASPAVAQGSVQSDVERIEALIRKAKLPVRAPAELSADQYMQHMAVDKKVLQGKLRLVLLRSIGGAVISDDFDNDALITVLEDYREYAA